MRIGIRLMLMTPLETNVINISLQLLIHNAKTDNDPLCSYFCGEIVNIYIYIHRGLLRCTGRVGTAQ